MRSLRLHQQMLQLSAGRVGQRLEVSPTARLCFDDLQMMVNAAQAGMGLARLPAWLVGDALHSGALVQLFDEPQPFGYELNIVWQHTRYLPLKCRVVVDLLLQKLPPLLDTRNRRFDCAPGEHSLR